MRILSSANINFTHDYTEGTVMFEHEGHQYQTSQQPYISDSGETYQASLIDEDGDWAGCVYWDVVIDEPEDCDDESHMCDWDVFTVHLDK